tara:strand:- start:738 stop:1064 length:327 start_codon:yes stop_codon:yes gene_type:complete
MPIFIKTEKFKNNTLKLSEKDKRKFLLMHKEWVRNISQSGQCIYSGYLINEKKIPGGGGLLMIEANDYLTAKKIIENDPMIKNELVVWELQEWIPINVNQPIFFNHLG